MKKLFVGTSGWLYKEWAGVFYAKDLKKGTELEHYATVFDTVEINATFYRLPTPKIVQGWYDRSPEGFVFAVKGGRFITHIKRLVVQKPSIAKFYRRADRLREKCGPLLWQLPPNFHFDPDRLHKFLKKLGKKYRQAFEFRHLSWYENPKSFEILREHNVAHVSVSSLRMPMNLELTSGFTYIRFHGLKGGPHHDYTAAELRPWAIHTAQCIEQGLEVYAYFNNDLNVRAPDNALAFRKAVQRRLAQ
jgi:uncharacterized protein YecE (DUF72 family)